MPDNSLFNHYCNGKNEPGDSSSQRELNGSRKTGGGLVFFIFIHPQKDRLRILAKTLEILHLLKP